MTRIDMIGNLAEFLLQNKQILQPSVTLQFIRFTIKSTQDATVNIKDIQRNAVWKMLYYKYLQRSNCVKMGRGGIESTCHSLNRQRRILVGRPPTLTRAVLGTGRRYCVKARGPTQQIDRCINSERQESTMQTGRRRAKKQEHTLGGDRNPNKRYAPHSVDRPTRVFEEPPSLARSITI